MSEIKVNKISPRTACGTTTLGDSGDSFVIPAGATITNNGTQTGFGRTGTVDWQTSSIKTSTFTAANGEGYFANTSGGAFVMNLPAGSAGNIVSVVDYTNTFQTNSLTITPNGSQKIGGVAASFIASTEGQSLTFVYVDDTEGWKNVQDSTSNAIGNPFVQATGGTITTSGNDKIHTFTGPGTFTVTAAAACAANNIVSHLIIGGAGGAGAGNNNNAGAGGGAGGYREVKSPVTPYTASPLDGYPSAPNRVTVTAQGYPIVVGAGGGGAPSGPGGGTCGNNSSFGGITAALGGSGGSGNGNAGGSGGGAGGGGTGRPGGAGNTPPVSPAQGFPGGASPPDAPDHAAGGGGGATEAGAGGGPGGPNPSGRGGAGTTTSITASPVAYAGGGGGSGSGPGGGAGAASPCGTGGAGVTSGAGNAGTTNRGAGGGAAKCAGQAGGNGGSGIVVIRYKFQ